jgi:hypothetical protein
MLCAEMHGQLKNVLPRTVHQYLCEKFGGNAGRAHVPLETDTQVLALLVNLFETIRLSLYTVVGRHRHTFQIAADWKSPPTVNYDAVTAFLLKHHLELAKVFDMSNSPGGPTARSIGYPRFIDLAILVLPCYLKALVSQTCAALSTLPSFNRRGPSMPSTLPIPSICTRLMPWRASKTARDPACAYAINPTSSERSLTWTIDSLLCTQL